MPPRWRLLEPVKPLMEFRVKWGLIFVAVDFSFIGDVAGTIWLLCAEDRFGRDTTMIGFSLAAFGVFHAGTQAVLVGPVGQWLGPKGAVVLEVGGWARLCRDGAGRAGLDGFPIDAAVRAGRDRHADLSIHALGAGDGYRQGAVIGLFSGLTSFVSIFAPFTISMIYFATRARAPGTVWILGASMQLVAVQFVLAALKDRRAPVVA